MIKKSNKNFTVVSLCSGAGGFDLGFELAGFSNEYAIDIDYWATKTLVHNRPNWSVSLGDICDLQLGSDDSPDVLLAGVPCQGFSLGGNREGSDPRNQLYKHVIRIALQSRPRVIVIENVLNLRTVKSPETGRSFALKISEDLKKCGYTVFEDTFKMCYYGVPQTRRRFIFVAFLEQPPRGYTLPQPDFMITPIRQFLFDLVNSNMDKNLLKNHDPCWGFQSSVHFETGQPFSESEVIKPIRFSRTASDGNPIRSYDEPFPAIDTATVWGWAQGNIKAVRQVKDRINGKYIRNPKADVTLWRISASRLRSFTHREYARLQTFPDSWEFLGSNKRDIHKQIGNAVPVEFSRRLAENIQEALMCIDTGAEFSKQNQQLVLF
jgi:DNA (cytosine-5)-methyltransferase 1